MKRQTLLLLIVLMLAGCKSHELLQKDHIYRATESPSKRPSGDGARITFTGYLFDLDGATDIIVTANGDTIYSETTVEESYTLKLIPRNLQRVDFINDTRVKTMVLVNFTEYAERETYDVFFKSPDNVTLIKTRPRDAEWKVVYWRPTKHRVDF